jgi:hypothetical protein
MTETPDNAGNPGTTADDRAKDDRRATVNPVENPVPSSPEPDSEAVRKGRETLDRVTSS